GPVPVRGGPGGPASPPPPKKAEPGKTPKPKKGAPAKASPAPKGRGSAASAKRLEEQIESAETALAAVEDELADPSAWATPEASARATARHQEAKQSGAE